MQFYKSLMNKKIIFISLAIIVVLVLLSIFGRGKKTDEQVLSTSQANNNTYPSPSPVITVVPADRIEIVHFHATQQCWSCITVGQYALKTIKEKFPDEFTSGKITFKDINGELKENQEIVVKYQARGSSLFVNAIRGDKDDISEDTNIWRLVNNENNFISYFENRLKTLLGK